MRPPLNAPQWELRHHNVSYHFYSLYSLYSHYSHYSHYSLYSLYSVYPPQIPNPKSPLLFQVVVEIAGDALVKVHALVAAHIVWFAGIHVEVGLRAGGDACL